MMKDKRLAPRFILAAILSVVMCIAISIVWQVTQGCYNDRPPLRSFYVVTTDLSQQKQINQIFQQFANKNGFSFNITYYTPNHEQLLMVLTRKDSEIDANNVPFGLEKYPVDFYNNDCLHPTVATDIGGLVNELKNDLSQIPNVIITDEK